MNVTLIILASVFVLLGLVGSVVPAIPGPPLSWVGLLLFHFSSLGQYDITFLVVTAVVAAVITVMDFVLPSLSTKKRGGSKAGIWGCNIGLVVSIMGAPFGPQGLLGIIFWPFVGALIGELIAGKKDKEVLRAAWGAFLGFLTGTLLKFFYCLFVIIFIVVDLV